MSSQKSEAIHYDSELQYNRGDYMHVNQKVNIHNKFEVFSQNIETGESKQIAEGYNIVLDQMWTRLCGGLSYFANIHFGTGAGTPSAARTSLFTHLGTKTAVDEEQVKALPVSRWKRKIVLNPEEFVGSIITEVGISFGATATNLVTHAMLKDAEGNPISIEKSDTEIITIFSTVFVTIANQTGVIMLGMPSSNQLINYLIGGAVAPTGSFGLLQFINATSRLGSTATVTWTSDVPNKKRKTSVPRFGINDGNGHVTLFEFTNLFAAEFPTTGIFTGQPYTDVPIGVGDGSNKNFYLPSLNVDVLSITIKQDGVTSNEYTHEKLKIVSGLQTHPNSAIAHRGFGVSKTGNKMIFCSSTKLFYYMLENGIYLEKELTLPSGVNISKINQVWLSRDGNTIAIAFDSTSTDKIKIIRLIDNIWVDITYNLPQTVQMFKIVLSDNADVIGLYDGNNATTNLKLYRLNDDNWDSIAHIGPAQFLYAIQISPDGNILAIGTNVAPRFRTYDIGESTTIERAIATTQPTFTTVNFSFANEGLTLAVGFTEYAPYAYVYDWNGSAWIARTDIPTTQYNASHVVLNDEGTILVTWGNSATYTHSWNGAQWSLIQTILFGGTNRIYAYSDINIIDAPSLGSPGVRILDFRERLSLIKFNTSPASGKAITSDYTVEGVHKTINYIVDCSYSIQFGEGA